MSLVTLKDVTDSVDKKLRKKGLSVTPRTRYLGLEDLINFYLENGFFPEDIKHIITLAHNERKRLRKVLPKAWV